MTDPIDRRAAIDAIVAWTVEDRPDIEMPTDLVGRINALPPAQPEIIRCKDCKYAYNHWHCKYAAWWNDSDDFCSNAERREDVQ